MNNQSKNSNVSDELLYEFVMDEMEQESELIKGLWAKALAHSEGNDSKAKSLYMQYRVQAIKDQLSALQIDLGDLSKEELFESIKNGFTIIPEKIQIIKEQKAVEKEKAIETAIEEEAKKENEKYSKFGGWLIVLAVFIVLGNLFSFMYVERYFENESLDTLKLLYQNGLDGKATILKTIAYLSFVSYGLLLAFTVSFFRKAAFTKNLAIIYFTSNIIAFPIVTYLLMQIDLPTMSVMSGVIGGIFQVLFSLIWIRYFMISERVKKTFVNGYEDSDNSFMHIILAGFGAIALASVLFANQSDKNILMAGQTTVTTTEMTTDVATTVEVEPAAREMTAEEILAADAVASLGDVWIDTSTGLMWQDTNQEIKTDWYGAMDYCDNLTYAGYADWKLPSVENSKVLYSKKHYLNYAVGDYYWSSSINDDSYGAGNVEFKNGNDYFSSRNRNMYVRCVRGQ